MADFEGWTEDDLYNAFAEAETGEYSDPWRRTEGTAGQRAGTETGSNAYGPVQLLSSTLANTIKPGHVLRKQYSKDELAFIDRFIEQGEKFWLYGGKDMVSGVKVGGVYVSQGKEEYGYTDPTRKDPSRGTGDLSVSDRKLYKSVAKKILKSEVKRLGGIKNLKRSWRGKEDPEYFKRFDKALRRSIDESSKAALFPDETLMENMLS